MNSKRHEIQKGRRSQRSLRSLLTVDMPGKGDLVQCMQMVRIKFANAAKEAEGFLALARQLKVICFADNTYEFPKSGLKILDELAIPYEVTAAEGFDRACHALRNSLASKV